MSLSSTHVKSPILDYLTTHATLNLVIDKLVAYHYSVPTKILTIYPVGSPIPFFQVLKPIEFAELDERITSFYHKRYGNRPSLVQLNTSSSQARVVIDKIINYCYGYDNHLMVFYTTSPSGILPHVIDIDGFNDIDQAIAAFSNHRYDQVQGVDNEASVPIRS